MSEYAVMPLTDWQSILDSVRAKTGKTTTLVSSDVSGEIDSINGGYGDIPTYHFIESARVLENIENFKAAHPNNIIFGAVSDIHVYNANTTYETKSKASIKHAAFALEMVGAMAECDFIVNLGDNCWENGIDTDNALMGATYSINALKNAFARLTRYNLVGNHDKSDNTQGQYNLIGSYNEFDDYGTTQIRGFGYKDYTDKKVRVIVLNTCDYLNASGGCAMSYEQKDFLVRALDLSAKTDYAEWQILLLSHIPLDWNGGDYNFYTDLQTILTAYENGTTASITVTSSYALNETPSNYSTYSSGKLVYNYSGKNSAKIIANIHGHVHTNVVNKIANTSIARVATANANPDLNKTESYPDYGDYSITTTEAAKIVKVSGTAKDTSATFYCIDLDEQIIYSYGYGADIDRTVIYESVPTYTVTYNLTNCISSNTTTVVVESDLYKAIITPIEDATIDSVVITMGGVDITATAWNDDDKAIYIGEVTGDVVITATAVDSYAPYWDIANRTQMAISASASATKDINRHNYYVGASSTGAFYGSGYITGLSVSGNDVTFTSSSKAVGIGLPYHLESGASYTFSATATASARLRIYQLTSSGVFVSGSEVYSSSGTNLTKTFTAPTDETIWTVLLLDTNTVGTSITYTNISLTKN